VILVTRKQAANWKNEARRGGGEKREVLLEDNVSSMNKQYIPYGEAFSHRLTRPPKALLRARLDNIAIVPASMLPFKESWQKVANGLPEGGVFLMTAKENGRQASHALILQKGILERVGKFWRGRGHRVVFGGV
jgi:hypothetical protein